ncbi:MAG: SAM-dependent methyltransferase, partial [Prevotella sp.]|nr:SAM-dependent methyltransferase [Prevotella sp.]
DKILASDGQLLCDSSDISYVFENEEGIIELPDTDYYGEINYQMRYRDIIGEPFSWLYVDAETLRQVAEKHGYGVEIIAEGKHDDYLARIFKNNQ